MKLQLFYPLLIIIASSSYGLLSTIIKVAMGHGFTTSEAVTSQYLVGFVLALILFLFTQRSIPKINKSGIITILAAGALTANTGMVYGLALNYVTASLGVVLFFQFTWIGLFIDCALHKRWPNRFEAFSLLFLFGGTILAAGVLDTDLSTIPWQGWVYGLLAATSFAVFIQVNSRQIEGMSTITRTFLMSLIAVIVISIFLAPEIIWNGTLFNTNLWIFGIILGVLGIILPILLFSIAVPKVGGALSSILSAMELPVAIIASVIILHETLTMLQLFGIVLVLVGMVLPTVLAQRKNAA
ncbi:EamA family transporter [Ureibacillus chungkukjangi]|uniref:Threonine/homoserine efflux transporter RhtA n=1 Tax=Ureibacillus chungkukjangi TaxID=1202712 RepID=A0A318TWF8_9BACL|nr:DMT family transporter [Ureibacillus chungkukjangi]MCM3390123.1 DMT family transporter [Ureibacillus chungkukjangi]PYF06315.1 threonine/homoserine efflux transporter RhtA [Ureibacillus chungkukjangi]